MPVLLALVVVAFSLGDRPPAVTSELAADAFTGARAFGPGSRPARNSLRELGGAFPVRGAGSAGDAGLADRVAGQFRASGFRVARRTAAEPTTDGRTPLETVVGVRPGLSSRRIIVLAHRDAATAPALAELSGTAALLELARVFRTRDTSGEVRAGEAPRAVGRQLERTLVLVSTSGSLGGAGARAWAQQEVGPVDAVLLLGDLAGEGARKPWVVPWSNGAPRSPLALRRTVEAAVRAEVGADPGGARGVLQWARRALPYTVSEQGAVAAAGHPAVLLSRSGERGPAPGAPVSEVRLEEFGRAALRAVSALDAAGAPDGAPFAREPAGILALRNVLPDWAVRLLVGVALLPALLAALDLLARARRRGARIGAALWWGAGLGAPVLLAWLWVRVLGLTGALSAPPGPVRPGVVPFGAGEVVAVGSVALVAGLVTFLVGRARRGTRAGGRGRGGGGAGAGVGIAEPRRTYRFGRPAPSSPVAYGPVAAATLCLLTVAVWVANPYAAALLVPACHLWLWAGAGAWTRRWVPLAALFAGLLPLALLAGHVALVVGAGPLGAAWSVLLAIAGGHLFGGLGLVVAVVLACGVGTLRAALTAERAAADGAPPREQIVTRGPLSYAGPGSLGGTGSALRR